MCALCNQYLVTIRDNIDGRLLRVFYLPISPNMVISYGQWRPGADIPAELVDDDDAQVIWYGINEGNWPDDDDDGVPLFATEQLTDDDGWPVATWTARQVPIV